MNKYTVNFGGRTHAGMVKEFNADAILDFKILNGHVFMVCDGHDGEQGHGALAAKLTTESIKKYFYNRSYKDMGNALTNAVTFANYSVFEQSQKNPKYKGMGATLAIMIYRDGKVYYAYAGDSRIYYFRNNTLQPLTRDHVKDVHDAPNSEVTVLLGKNRDIKFGVSKKPLLVETNDMFLLCTDGLTDEVSDTDLVDVLKDRDTSPEHKSLLLTNKANESGGKDNLSMYLVQFDSPKVAAEAKATQKKPVNKTLITVLLSVLIASVLGFGGYQGIKYLAERPSKPKAEKKEVSQADQKQNKAKEQQAEKKEQPSKKKGSEKTTPKKTETVKNTQKVENKQSPAQKTGTVYYNHPVKYGENLYRIGLRYNVSQQKLIDINGNKAKNLIAGSNLKIPVRAVHVVKAGESYSVISDMYNIKIKRICETNKINESDPLKKGQKIVIPVK